MTRTNPARGEIWRHIKTGSLYKILLLGKDEATGDDVVIYQNIDKKAHPTVWVRKLSIFMEATDAFGMPRFQRYECDR